MLAALGVLLVLDLIFCNNAVVARINAGFVAVGLGWLIYNLIKLWFGKSLNDKAYKNK